MGKRNIWTPTRSLVVEAILFILLLNSGCSNSKPSQNSQIRESVMLISHNSTCEPVRGIILGLDRDFTFSNLSLQNKTISGVVKPINKNDTTILYYIYSIDKLRCFYTLVGKSKPDGSFKISLDKNNSYGFVSNKLNGDADEYVYCIDIEH